MQILIQFSIWNIDMSSILIFQASLKKKKKSWKGEAEEVKKAKWDGNIRIRELAYFS